MLLTVFLERLALLGDASHHCFPGGSDGNQPAMWETYVRFLGWEDPLEEGMATHSSILAWIIPWTEEPGGVQSMGSQESDRTERLSTVPNIMYFIYFMILFFSSTFS